MDKERLLAWLLGQAAGHRSVLVGAIYAGLVDRDNLWRRWR